MKKVTNESVTSLLRSSVVVVCLVVFVRWVGWFYGEAERLRVGPKTEDPAHTVQY